MDKELKILEDFAYVYKELVDKLSADLNDKQYQDPKTGRIV